MPVLLDSDEVGSNRLAWFNAHECTSFSSLLAGSSWSGKIVDGDWDLQAQPIMDSFKIKACIAHWREGKSWEETGIYQFMLNLIAAAPSGRVDGCRTLKDVIRRYSRMDQLFKDVKALGRLLTSYECGNSPSRELETGGIVINVGRDGQPIFAGSGNHRLAIALTLDLERVPMHLGAVHPLYLERLKLSGRKPMGYQSMRSPNEKFATIMKSIDMERVASVLDVGCNQGILTSLFAEKGVFAVGVDVVAHFLDSMKGETTPAFGVIPMTEAMIPNLPGFGVVLLLSVHHQWLKTDGEETARRMVKSLAEKASEYFVIEFAALRDKYGFGSDAPFRDNDEESVVAYGQNWLRELGIAGTVRHIGKNRESKKKEPYRYLFVVDRRQCSGV